MKSNYNDNNNDNDNKYTILQRSIFLTINVLLAIVMILGNKAVFTNLKFKYPIALTTIHYIVTWIGVESLRRLKFYKQVCVIPFSRKGIFQYMNLKTTYLEKKESIDMLRFLENDIRVKMISGIAGPVININGKIYKQNN